jgi:hypothetical protein
VAIEKLVAGQKGSVLNSHGGQVREAVNALIDANTAVLSGTERTKRAACAGVSFMAQQTQSGSTTIFRDIGYLTHLFVLMGCRGVG